MFENFTLKAIVDENIELENKYNNLVVQYNNLHSTCLDMAQQYQKIVDDQDKQIEIYKKIAEIAQETINISNGSYIPFSNKNNPYKY